MGFEGFCFRDAGSKLDGELGVSFSPHFPIGALTAQRHDHQRLAGGGEEFLLR